MKIYFRKHVLKRMKERLVSVQEIVDCVTKGSYFFEGYTGKEIKYSAVYKGTRIVLYENKASSKVHVVTVTPSKLKKQELVRKKEETNLSFTRILSDEKGINAKSIGKEIQEFDLYRKPLIV